MFKCLGLVAAAVISLAAVPLAASASVFGTNLIVNGDAEAGPGATFDGEIKLTPDLHRQGNFTPVTYTAGAGFPVAGDPGVSVGGKNFFSGGPGNGSSGATQMYDISSGASLFDLGTSSFNLSAYLGGYQSQGDNAVLTISFLSLVNGHTSVISTASLGPVTAADRGNLTGLLFRETSGLIPVGARMVYLNLQMTRLAGSFNDGYADNLSLVLTPGAVPTPGGVPEPATWAMMLVGIGGLGYALRRRRPVAIA
jgi:hypothetical protein